MTQLPKTVDYSVGLMSMKQKCLQQFPKKEGWHWHVSPVWWQWVPDGRAIIFWGENPSPEYNWTPICPMYPMRCFFAPVY